MESHYILTLINKWCF